MRCCPHTPSVRAEKPRLNPRQGDFSTQHTRYRPQAKVGHLYDAVPCPPKPNPTPILQGSPSSPWDSARDVQGKGTFLPQIALQGFLIRREGPIAGTLGSATLPPGGFLLPGQQGVLLFLFAKQLLKRLEFASLLLVCELRDKHTAAV